MGLFHYLWSRTAASNATADSNVNWAEGMAPSAVNDSARAMMASAAAFRDDIAGAIVTGGTSTAYALTSYQIFDTLAHMSGQMIAFTPHATNGATVTLNVDGLGAKPLRSAPSVELLAGTLVLGTPYTALYNNSDAAWYLCNFYASTPYNVPIGGMMDYIGSASPNSSFVLPIGQAISRSTYASLFSLISTTYGVGDGSTTFNVPDLTGRITAMKEASATRLTSTYFGGNSTVLGATGGAESQALTAAQIPSITSVNPGSIALSVTTTVSVMRGSTQSTATSGAAITGTVLGPADSAGTLGAGAVAVTSNNTNGNAHNNVQPTIIVNKILRVI